MKKNLKLCLYFTLFVPFYFISCTKNEVINLTINSTSKNFIIGQTDSLIATITASGDVNTFPITWTTSDKRIVSVTKGKIKGLSGGIAIISAKSGNRTATCEVKVNSEITTVMTKGYLYYWGDVIRNNESNLFQIGLAGLNDTLYININTLLTSVDELAIGNYTILSTTDSLYFEPFTVIPGVFREGEIYYSWYISKIESPIKEGNFNVISVANGIYTIEFNLVDGFGNTINGSFHGSLNYSDKSKVSLLPRAIKSLYKYL